MRLSDHEGSIVFFSLVYQQEYKLRYIHCHFPSREQIMQLSVQMKAVRGFPDLKERIGRRRNEADLLLEELRREIGLRSHARSTSIAGKRKRTWRPHGWMLAHGHPSYVLLASCPGLIATEPEHFRTWKHTH